MARLLAAEAEPVGVERGQHVAVPDGGLAYGDPVALHGQAESEVGHHGDGDGVPGQASPLGQVEGEEGEQHVAVDDGAGVVDRDHPVGVAVEGQAEVGLVLDDRSTQLRRVGRAALVVDVGPVGRGVQRR